MAKNVVVTDAKGNAIGSTYPKRARGLVKHGRAVYVDDCTIRLLHTTAPSVVTNNDNKELFFMNNNDFHFQLDAEEPLRTACDAEIVPNDEHKKYGDEVVFAQRLEEIRYPFTYRCNNVSISSSDSNAILTSIKPVDEVTIYLHNCDLTQVAFEMIINKLGKDGAVEFHNCRIGNEQENVANDVITKSNACCVSFTNCVLTGGVITRLVNALGDFCNLIIDHSIVSHYGFNSTEHVSKPRGLFAHVGFSSAPPDLFATLYYACSGEQSHFQIDYEGMDVYWG